MTPTMVASAVTHPNVQTMAGQVVPVAQGLTWNDLTPEFILSIGAEEEKALTRTLDQYMERITAAQDPKLFRLVDKLQESVEKENLIPLATQIIDGKLTIPERIIGMFSPARLQRAKTKAYEMARNLASGKTKNLKTVIAELELELTQELTKLNEEMRVLAKLQDDYKVATLAFSQCLAEANKILEHFKTLPTDDPADPSAKHTRQDKLQMLQSRIGAHDATLTRMPADIEVVRQLMQSGFSTVQEVSTTTASRFNSIRMTLLTLHGALMNRAVHQLEEKGAALDANLLQVRSKITADVCATSAGMSGKNRITEAQQIQQIVDETATLVKRVDEARRQNEANFITAAQIRNNAKQQLLNSYVMRSV